MLRMENGLFYCSVPLSCLRPIAEDRMLKDVLEKGRKPNGKNRSKNIVKDEMRYITKDEVEFFKRSCIVEKDELVRENAGKISLPRTTIFIQSLEKSKESKRDYHDRIFNILLRKFIGKAGGSLEDTGFIFEMRDIELEQAEAVWVDHVNYKDRIGTTLAEKMSPMYLLKPSLAPRFEIQMHLFIFDKSGKKAECSKCLKPLKKQESLVDKSSFRSFRMDNDIKMGMKYITEEESDYLDEYFEMVDYGLDRHTSMKVSLPPLIMRGQLLEFVEGTMQEFYAKIFDIVIRKYIGKAGGTLEDTSFIFELEDVEFPANERIWLKEKKYEATIGETITKLIPQCHLCCPSMPAVFEIQMHFFVPYEKKDSR